MDRDSMPRRRKFFLVVLLISTIQRIDGSCPNYIDRPYCSGHGDCTIYGRCDCWNGWQGGDCSERTCPTGAAWNDVATADNVAHAEAECSNRGYCDRAAGRCVCDYGFGGSACERLSCQGVDSAGEAQACSGKGICVSMADYAKTEWNAESVQYSYENVWDAHKIYGCICGDGYYGPSCSERACPSGDDPLTASQSNEVQIISCGGIGSFALRFKGYKSAPIYHHYNVNKVKEALSSLGTTIIGEISVSFSYGDKACHAEQVDFEERNVISIEFLTLFGRQIPELLIVDDQDFAGSVELKSARVDGELAYLRSGDGYVYAQQGEKEYDECARRGVCDPRSGTCSCYATNFELYGSSNLYGRAGTVGDCGYPLNDITTCPGDNECSGHGVCVGTLSGLADDVTAIPTLTSPRAEWTAAKPFQCICQNGWRLGDCSERICPRGKSWFSYPTATDQGHDAWMECSGIGTCDRNLGTCTCPKQFSGAACEYMHCPKVEDLSCNGVGRCLSMRQLALHAGMENGLATQFMYGDDPNDASTWDADRIYGCLCDDGFTGHDCSLRTCPFGDDPGTWGQINELQLLRCRASEGTFTLTFREQTTSEIAFDATAQEIENALVALSTIGKIEVGFSYGSSACTNSGTWNIISVQFVTEHSDLPPLVVDDSGLSRGSKTVKFDIATDGDALADNSGASYTSAVGTTESEECSNRGLCDHTVGECTCFHKYSMSDGKGGPGNIADCGYRIPI